MNIACSNCPAKYAVPDEKVRGRKVKITCKRCGATIIIDGTAPKGAGPRSEFATPSAPPASVAAAPTLWTVAVTEEDHQEMTAEQVVAAYKAGTIDAETFVWREGMPEWLTPFEIPQIEAALRAKGIEQPKPEAPAAVPAPAPQASTSSKSSGWREPGRWDSGKAAGDLTFDDVTVAMAAPKAQALLDAISPTEKAAPAEAAAANPFAEDEATIVADSSRFALATDQEPAPAAPAPAAGAPAEPKKELVAEEGAAEPPPDTARSQEASVPRGKMPSVPGRPRPKLPSAPGASPRAPVKAEEVPASMTGARSESSVLFSLDQLVGKEKPRTSADKEERVDARALIGAAKSNSDSAPPSLANLAAGPMFAAPVMAAPDFTAPPPVSSKPVHSAPVASVAPLAPPQTASRAGRWIVLALLVIGGGGAAAFFMMRPPAPVPPVETPQAAAKSETAATTMAVPGSAGAPVAVDPVAAIGSGAPPLAPTGAAAAAGSPQKATVTGVAAKKSSTGAAAAGPSAAPTAQAATDGPPFDAEAAKAALSAAAAAAQGQCASEEGSHGSGKVTVTFVNSGRATNAVVAGDFAGSALGGCIARVFRSAKVPAFSGDTVHVSKGVQIP